MTRPWPRSRIRSIPLSILATLLFLAAACRRDADHVAPAERAAAAPRAVRTAAVEAVAEAGRVVAATVTARQRATLASRMSAAVVRLPFREGEAVRSGQVVVQLADEALGAALAAAEAELVAATADRERMERLLERDAATPRETESVRARAAASEAEVSAARDALRYAVLRAPFSGRLARRFVHEGDVVAPGQPLVEIEGEDGFELRASADAAAAAAIDPGMTLPAEVDGVPGTLVATVRAVLPAGDPGTHRFEVVAKVESVEGLRSGLYGRLHVPGAGAARADETLTIPAGTAFERGGLTGVFVADDGVARLRWIAAGRREGERLAVRAGLEAGERVVLDPAALADGDAIVEER